MPLTKDDPEVLANKGLAQTWNMPVFLIDMIKDGYNTKDPFIIAQKLKEIFDIENLSIEEIIELIYFDMSPLDPFTTCMQEIFKDR